MASFLAVPLKKTYKVDLVSPLKNFIRNTYTHAEPDVYTEALPDFDNLRNTSTKVLDKHESSLEIIYRYYDQLVAVENKLPITESQNRVQFKWKSAFEEGGLLASGKNLAISSSAYEKVCVLFNIAALQSQVASVQNHDSNDGLKLCVKLFQQASGIFEHLMGCVLSQLQQTPTPDLLPETLHALSNLMLAQAQEAIYKKATQDKMKDAMVAKVCLQVAELYGETAKLITSGGNKNMWPKYWLETAQMKQAAFRALSEYHQSCSANVNKHFGEGICRLKKTMELFGMAQSQGGSVFCFQTAQARAKKALEVAEKDNNFIYNDRIPDYHSLQSVTPAAVAKPTPLASPMAAKFTDLFEKLVPLPVQQALTSFDSRKSQALNMEVGRLREATQLINSVLASLNLPAAIEDLSGEGVPQSLMEKAQQIQELGGLAKIDQLMSDLPELLSRNREILNESIKCLDDEEKSDKQLKEQFKDQWSRTASATLTRPMRDEAMKYKSILDTAIQADLIVKEKYNKNQQAIGLLSKPKAELEASLPSAKAAATLQNSEAVKTLRKLIDQVDTIKAERDVIESELKGAEFDMRGRFVEALAADGALDEETISATELEKTYSPLREQISDSIMRQEKILASIQTANTTFCNDKSSNQTASEREQLLKDLAAGFDSYMELKGNLEEGTKFYNDLTPLLVRLQTKINDFCFARKTEKDELMADLQKAIANRPTETPPVLPSYQGGPGQQPTTQAAGASPAPPRPAPRSAPPARPPPPSVPPSTAAAATSQAPPAASSGPAPSVPAASAPSGPSAPLPYSPNPAEASQVAPPYGHPPTMPYGQQGHPGYPGGSWPAPYPSYPGGSYPMPQMPTGYNPFNPYGSYPQQPQQGYPGMQQPQQGYPGQQPQQGYPGQQPPAQAGYPYPSYPPQGGTPYPSQQYR